MTRNKKDAFLKDFEDLLVHERIAERARPHYVKHLERWGAALRARPTGTSKEDFLEGYFNKLVHTEGVEAFQVRQVLEAVRLAHEVLLKEAWTGEVDWEGMRSRVEEDYGSRKRLRLTRSPRKRLRVA